jgi:hypothetical protein
MFSFVKTLSRLSNSFFFPLQKVNLFPFSSLDCFVDLFFVNLESNKIKFLLCTSFTVLFKRTTRHRTALLEIRFETILSSCSSRLVFRISSRKSKFQMKKCL